MSSMTTVRRAFAAATKSDVFLGTSFSGAELRAHRSEAAIIELVYVQFGW
jgi:hypothetical protein